uniref:hypothetical protein n=1 Tax=Thaumasiovibrio occultus TaxID=1891184 RepID=UPI000B362936|nr:hypothetical protein [Thaumasiovibrio occultus]
MKLGYLGVFFGTVALIMAFVQFTAGPFNTEPTIETVVADKVTAISNAAIEAISGKPVVEEKSLLDGVDIDKALQVAIAVVGGLAMMFAVVSFIRKEPTRLFAAAAALGAGAIAVQWFAMYVLIILALLFVITIIAGVS